MMTLRAHAAGAAEAFPLTGSFFASRPHHGGTDAVGNAVITASGIGRRAALHPARTIDMRRLSVSNGGIADIV